MSNRELVIDLVNKLPEDTPLESIIEKIAFVAGVQEGLDQADRGEGYSLEEIRKMIEEWNTPSS
jgi:predicted transcriptional regulator